MKKNLAEGVRNDHHSANTYLVADKPLTATPLGGSARLGGQRITRVNHLTAVSQVDGDELQVGGYTLTQLAEQMAAGNAVQAYQDFGGRVCIRFLPKPANPKPRIVIVEHTKLCSYLGNYGAGKVVKTFSLLPGEQTQISVRSYKDQKRSYYQDSSVSSTETASTYYSDDESSLSTRSENILDSFSQYAADQLQNYLEHSTQHATATDVSNSIAGNFSAGGGVNGGINIIGLIHFDAGGGAEASTNTTTTSNAHRSDLVNDLHTALSSHVEESSTTRDVEVNTTTANTSNHSQGGNWGSSNSSSFSAGSSSVFSMGEETSTLRSLQNINWSRTLNFVFRQLLQEYVTLTWLNDVSIVYSNGYPESKIVAKLSDLDTLIDKVIDPTKAAEVKKAILLHLCNVLDYQGVKESFAEKVTETWSDCDTATVDDTYVYYRKKLGLSQSYSTGGLTFTVPGIILKVANYVLRTDSLIVDSVLGQGEALDCYNQRLQNEAAENAEIRNDRFVVETTMQKELHAKLLGILDSITDPEAKADAYRKMVKDCCMEDLQVLLGSLCSGGGALSSGTSTTTPPPVTPA